LACAQSHHLAALQTACLSGRYDCLLGTALEELGISKPDKRVDVVAKWSFDLGLIASANDPAWLA
jgi:hypothetical protein